MNFKNIKKIAEKEWAEKKLKNRVQALSSAIHQKDLLIKKIASIESDLKKAEAGDWLVLVEKYVSPQAAEEFE